jgi:hypothetical protein
MGSMENPGAGMGVAALTLTLEAENTAHGKTRFDKNCCILTPHRFSDTDEFIFYFREFLPQLFSIEIGRQQDLSLINRFI